MSYILAYIAWGLPALTSALMPWLLDWKMYLDGVENYPFRVELLITWEFIRASVLMSASLGALVLLGGGLMARGTNRTAAEPEPVASRNFRWLHITVTLLAAYSIYPIAIPLNAGIILVLGLLISGIVGWKKQEAPGRLKTGMILSAVGLITLALYFTAGFLSSL